MRISFAFTDEENMYHVAVVEVLLPGPQVFAHVKTSCCIKMACEIENCCALIRSARDPRSFLDTLHTGGVVRLCLTLP